MGSGGNRGTGWRWPLWLMASVLLLGIPALIWSTRAWWPGFAAILGRIDPALCDLPPDVARSEEAADAARTEEATLRRSLAEGEFTLEATLILGAELVPGESGG